VRIRLKAHDYAAGGQVVMSLAGGRKTMSADMQWAASLFGCQALLHVVSDDQGLRNSAMAEPTVNIFSRALNPEYARLITPLIVGQTSRNDLLDISIDGVGAISSQDYPLELPEANQAKHYKLAALTLSHELSKREKESSRLLGNYLETISRQESHENWRSLYRLSPRQINYLRATKLDKNFKEWLIKIPKADLHRHMGGCLDINAQQQVAKVIWQTLSALEQQQALEACQLLLESTAWPWDWPEQLKQPAELRSHKTAAILLYASAEQLQTHLWACTEPRVNLKAHPQGFAAYERPGELTGSALLSHPASIKPYAQALVKQAVAEGLAYVELRGSPQKYAQPGVAFLSQLDQALHESMQSLPQEKRPRFRFIIIVDRRDNQEQSIKDTIQLAVAAKNHLPEFMAGLDMAGDEKKTSPEEIAHLFTPAFAECLSISIHAGEGEAADSIWQAAYHLHADRIGHGLSLHENDNLAQRFRDRNICLELCPSSNREVVGFYDPDYPATYAFKEYPIMAFWTTQGLPLTICTDNPGISRTSLADEYLTVARMCNHQLSLWDALAMIKQGFVHAFLPGKEKEQLIKGIDKQLYQIITEIL
jgi:adenosine deaminase